MNPEDLDPVLKQQLEEAGEEGQVEALVVVNAELDEDGTELAISKIQQQVEQDSELFDVMQSLGVIHLRAPGRVVKQLLDNDEIVSASSTEGEFFKP